MNSKKEINNTHNSLWYTLTTKSIQRDRILLSFAMGMFVNTVAVVILI